MTRVREGGFLSTLDGDLADLARTDLGVGSITVEGLRGKLVDRGVWWSACAEAVSREPQRLLGWFRGDDARITSLLGAQGDEVASQAVAAVGLLVVAARGGFTEDIAAAAAERVTSHWAGANVLTESLNDGRDRFDVKDADPGTRQALAALADLPRTPTRDFAQIAVALMTGAVEVPRYRKQIRLLFDTAGEAKVGRTGTLELVVLPGGPGGLFPDPRSMSFLTGDPDFAMALSAAWAYAVGTRANPPCVLWQIKQEGGRVRPIHGASLGAAFAVALKELLGFRSPLKLLRLFRTDCAVTGTVDAAGTVGKVEGLDGKFTAAQRKSWSVVAPAASSEADKRAAPPGLDVEWAGTVKEARRTVYRWRRRRTALAAAGLVVGLVGAAFVAQVITERNTSDATAQREKKANTAQTLIRNADGLRENQQDKAMRLYLAALAIDDSPATKAAVVAALTTERKSVVMPVKYTTITAVQLAANDMLLVAGDKEISLWNIRDRDLPVRLGNLTREFHTDDQVLTAAVSKDGRSAVVIRPQRDSSLNPSSYQGSYTELWDISNTAAPQMMSTFPGCPQVAAALSPSGRSVITGCVDGTATVWNVTAQKTPVLVAELTPKAAGLRGVAFAGENRVATASDVGLSVWNLGSPDRPISQGLGAAGATEFGAANAVSADATGESVVVGHGFGRTQVAEVQELQRSRDLRRLEMVGQTEPVRAVDGGGDLLVTGVGQDVVVWERQIDRVHRPRMILKGHSETVLAVALSADGRTAVSGGREGVVRIWEVGDRGQYVLRPPITSMPNPLRDLAFSRTASLAAGVSDTGEAILWDLANPAHPARITSVKAHSSPIRSAAHSPSAAELATGGEDGIIVVQGITNPELPTELARFPSRGRPVTALAFGPKGDVLAAGDASGAITLWPVTHTGGTDVRPLGSTPGTGKAVTALSFDPRGELVASGGDDKTVTLLRVSDPGHPAVVKSLPTSNGRVLDLSFNPKTRLLVEAGDESAAVAQWDMTNPEKPGEPPPVTGAPTVSNALAYNAEGTLLVTANRDGTATLWSVIDPNKPHRMATLVGHTKPVLSAGFTLDGGTILTGSDDRSAMLWDVNEFASIAVDPRLRACRLAKHGLTEEEWADQVKGFPYENKCHG